MQLEIESGTGHTLQVVHPVRTLGLLVLFLLAFGGGAMLGKAGVACMSWPEEGGA